MSGRLETPDEVARAMAERSSAEALLYIVDWLDRRDQISDQVALDHLAANFEMLAAELRSEAVGNLSPQTKGLIVAAAVLLDAAHGARMGDDLAEGPRSASVE